MTQGSGAHTALPKNPSSVSSIHSGQFKTPYNSSSRGFEVLLWPNEAPAHKHTNTVHTHSLTLLGIKRNDSR